MKCAPRPVACLVAGLCLVPSACGLPGAGDSAERAGSDESADLRSDLQRELQPDTTNHERAQLVDDNNAFALALYRQLREQPGELFISPLSVSIALAMTYGGARARTAAEMAAALHFGLAPDRLHPAFNDLGLALARRGGVTEDGRAWGTRLHLCNALWAQRDYAFDPAYLDLLALHYGAGLHGADFVHEAEAVRADINRWVAEQTEDRIPGLLPAGSLDDETRLVLVNAVYFQAAWAARFLAQDTAERPFHLRDGSVEPVRMMHGLQYLEHVVTEGYTAVRLPYDEHSASMLVVMPAAGTLEDFEQALDVEVLRELRTQLRGGQVALALPRWRFGSEVLDLQAPLRALGMVDAFVAQVADFSGMLAPAARELRQLYISRVLHRTFVEVSEGGTEAAAATAVVMADAGAAPGEPDPVTVLTFDRPFVYLIVDEPTGSILFVGRVERPQSRF